MQPIIVGNYLINPYLKKVLINKNFISTDMKIKLKENAFKETNYLSFEIYGNIKHNNNIINTLSRISPQLYIGEFVVFNENDDTVYDKNENIINVLAKGLNHVAQKEVYDLKEFIFDTMSQIAIGDDITIETENIIEYIIHIVDNAVDLPTELIGINDEKIEKSIQELENELANSAEKEYNENNIKESLGKKEHTNYCIEEEKTISPGLQNQGNKLDNDVTKNVKNDTEENHSEKEEQQRNSKSNSKNNESKEENKDNK